MTFCGSTCSRVKFWQNSRLLSNALKHSDDSSGTTEGNAKTVATSPANTSNFVTQDMSTLFGVKLKQVGEGTFPDFETEMDPP
ncbi:hypothetical protein TYRP_014159 [Tyrophagus putrescentiae]|nr:hypothetical protein TYRP_014159 [Tyrophagus putrescentiae]